MNLFDPHLTFKALSAAKQQLFTGEMSYGKKVEEFELKYSELVGKPCVATNSASAAAYMLFEFLKVKYSVRSVYTPSLGFVSPAWAAKHLGYNVTFVDVDQDLTLSSRSYSDLKHLLNDKSDNVLMPVLYGGVSTYDDSCILPQDDPIIVLDSAHCVKPTCRYDYAFFSFYPSKPLPMINGGVIATDDERCIDWCKRYRNFGRTPTEGGSYEVIQDGFKFGMDQVNAAIGLQMMQYLDERLEIRKGEYKAWRGLLPDLKFIDHDEFSSYYLCSVILPDKEKAKKIRQKLLPLHYPLLHQQRIFNQSNLRLEYSESIIDHLVQLPIHNKGAAEQHFPVVEEILNEDVCYS